MEQSKPCTYSANRISTLSLSRKGEASGERSFGHRLLERIHKLLGGCMKLDKKFGRKIVAREDFSCVPHCEIVDWFAVVSLDLIAGGGKRA
jgi:hypothetical protein